MAKKRKKTGPVAKGVRSCTFRLPPQLLDDLLTEAHKLDMSRNLLVTRLLRHSLTGLRAGHMANDAGLFDEAFDEMQKAVEDAIHRAMRTGGVDLALHRSGQVKRELKKQQRKARGKR